MGKIFYVMGKSASGKDTIYKKLLERFPGLKTVVTYTTRPIRDGETEGVEYHFTSVPQLEQMKTEGNREQNVRDCIRTMVLLYGK